MAPTRADDLLAGYPVSEGIFDEGFAADGTPRPSARAAWKRSLRAGPAELPGRVSRSLSAPACASPRSRATSSSTSTPCRA